MRKIEECVEDIKIILNNIERTEECNGETLVDINELIDEILTICSVKKRNIINKFREIGNIQFSSFSKPLITVEDAIKIFEEEEEK